MEITIKLDINEVNTVLNILGDAPFKVAAPLIEKIKLQGVEQVNAAQKPNGVEAEPAPLAN